MSEDRFGDLLGPYVQGDLPAEEEREVDLHLRRCPCCRAQVEDVRRAHGLLREAAAFEAPPLDLKVRVLARVRAQPMDAARVGPTTGGGRGHWVAAAALLVVFVGFGAFWAATGGPTRSLPLTATAAAPGAGGELRGEQVGENLRVELRVRDLPGLRGDEYYEVWYAKEGGGRISCGTFRAGPGGDAAVSMSAPVSAVSYPEIEVTREPDDGDPGTSGNVVLVGSLRDL